MPPPTPPRGLRMARGLQCLLDDFGCSANAFFARRVALANAAPNRRAVGTDDFQALLANTLKGCGDQICWTDEALRRHVLRRVNLLFGDDPHWCTLVTSAIYLLDPRSIVEIEQILDAHVESRSGAYASELFEGKGWNPARAIFFNGDSYVFGRAYVASSKETWRAVEYARNPAKTGFGANSGFDVSGRRGCVTRLVLRRSVGVEKAEALGETFLRLSRRLTTSALRDFVPDALSEAIRGRKPFDENVGPVRVRFHAVIAMTDPREPSACEFSLSFDHA